MTSSAAHLGNDIVDLADPRHTGKAGDERFLRRVCTEREQDEILAQADPDRALWMHWAGKEAAFKTVSKALGTPPIFVHSRFEVAILESGAADRLGGTLGPHRTHLGEVRYMDFLLPLRIEVMETALHAVTWLAPSFQDSPSFRWESMRMAEDPHISTGRQDWREELEPEFTPTEWACISHKASALTRLAARRSLAATLGFPEVDLEISCGPGKPGRRIPKVLLRGEELAVDLSLSHHGRLLAWAFLNHSQGR